MPTKGCGKTSGEKDVRPPLQEKKREEDNLATSGGGNSKQTITSSDSPESAGRMKGKRKERQSSVGSGEQKGTQRKGVGGPQRGSHSYPIHTYGNGTPRRPFKGSPSKKPLNRRMGRGVYAGTFREKSSSIPHEGGKIGGLRFRPKNPQKDLLLPLSRA